MFDETLRMAFSNEASSRPFSDQFRFASAVFFLISAPSCPSSSGVMFVTTVVDVLLVVVGVSTVCVVVRCLQPPRRRRASAPVAIQVVLIDQSFPCPLPLPLPWPSPWPCCSPPPCFFA